VDAIDYLSGVVDPMSLGLDTVHQLEALCAPVKGAHQAITKWWIGELLAGNLVLTFHRDPMTPRELAASDIFGGAQLRFDRNVVVIRYRKNGGGAVMELQQVRVQDRLAAAPVKTGAPGRPSSMHFIDDELARRAAEGRLLDTLKSEASALVAWLKESHPSAPRPAPISVENHIRKIYRQLKPTK
jgi:hypothetical protein